MAETPYAHFNGAQSRYLRQTVRQTAGALSPYACTDRNAQRRYTSYYPPYSADPDFYLVRGPYAVDIDKILHSAFYNRCTDKTQVFSFYHNDDITRRSLHLQLVSRIARTIGRALRLNLDLIEAIALGHDMGHTPFGHAGEQTLNVISVAETGRFFNHNVHSVRVLKDVLRTNLTLQTYDGIICHNGERNFEDVYRPGKCTNFEEFETVYEECYTQEGRGDSLRPGTLEGCVVRFCDILAYVGKDRQDAARAGLCKVDAYDENDVLGRTNLDILDNAVKNIVRSSIDQPYLAMDPEVARTLMDIRRENNELIYGSDEVKNSLVQLQPIMWDVYNRCLEDLKEGREESPIFQHHLSLMGIGEHYEEDGTAPQQQVIDYIASMTDDYLIDLHRYLFPSSHLLEALPKHPYFTAS